MTRALRVARVAMIAPMAKVMSALILPVVTALLVGKIIGVMHHLGSITSSLILGKLSKLTLMMIAGVIHGLHQWILVVQCQLNL
jgi:hypothetical protein